MFWTPAKVPDGRKIDEVEDLSEAGKWSVTTADNIRGVVGSAQIWTENKTKSLVVFQERF